MSKETKSDFKYNTTVFALWENEKGNMKTMAIDARTLDSLKKILEEAEIGGMFFIKRLPEKSRERFQNPDKAPHAFLEYISKKDVEDFAASQRATKGHSL